MKKVALSLLAFGLVGAMAFADDAAMAPKVTLGSWNRAIFVPVATGGLDAPGGNTITQAFSNAGWGGADRIGFTIAASGKDAGMEADLGADGGSVVVTDQWKVWVHPFDGANLQLGRSYEDTLRGSSDFGTYDWIRLGPITGDDLVFMRADTTGGELSYTTGPLFVFGALGANGASISTTAVNYNGIRPQAGVGYTIDGLGLVRAQVFTQNAVGGIYQQIQAAFRYTGMQGLSADIGGSFFSDTDKAGKTFIASTIITYTSGAATLNVQAKYTANKVGDAPLELGVGGDYALDGGIGIGADVRYYNKAAAGTDSLTTAGLFLTKAVSAGKVGIGLQYATDAALGANSFLANAKSGTAALLVPIKIEIGF